MLKAELIKLYASGVVAVWIECSNGNDFDIDYRFVCLFDFSFFEDVSYPRGPALYRKHLAWVLGWVSSRHWQTTLNHSSFRSYFSFFFTKVFCREQHFVVPMTVCQVQITQMEFLVNTRVFFSALCKVAELPSYKHLHWPCLGGSACFTTIPSCFPCNRFKACRYLNLNASGTRQESDSLTFKTLQFAGLLTTLTKVENWGRNTNHVHTMYLLYVHTMYPYGVD